MESPVDFSELWIQPFMNCIGFVLISVSPISLIQDLLMPGGYLKFDTTVQVTTLLSVNLAYMSGRAKGCKGDPKCHRKATEVY